jgi:hypothetical protein
MHVFSSKFINWEFIFALVVSLSCLYGAFQFSHH